MNSKLLNLKNLTPPQLPYKDPIVGATGSRQSPGSAKISSSRPEPRTLLGIVASIFRYPDGPQFSYVGCRVSVLETTIMILGEVSP